MLSKKKIFKIIKKVLKYFSITLGGMVLLLVLYFSIGFTKPAQNISWGVNFSQKHAANLKLNWKESYLAILDDLRAKKIKLSVHWDLIEPEKGKYNFDDLDWQITEAEKRNAQILLVMGMKTPRWPECHVPAWASGMDKAKQQDEILNMLKTIVLRYKERRVIIAWQVENEIFFPFGNCPWRDKNFLKKEVSLVKSLDKVRPVVVTDSGEYSLWWQAAKIGDIVGITMYKRVWFKEIRSYVSYYLPAVFYTKRFNLVKKLFYKDVACGELQAEPWGAKLLYDLPLAEQQKSMDLVQFKKNVAFAKKTGLNEFYFWGAEWWYWNKINYGDDQIWEEAKKMLK